MDNNNVLGEMLEKGQSLVTNQVKQVVKSTQQQISGSQQGQGQPAPDAGKQAQAADVSQDPLGPGIEQAAAVKQASQQTAQSSQKPANPLQQVTGTPQNTPAEMAQMEATRKKLLIEQHKSTYFNPTFNPQKRKEEPVAEKLEREKQEDLWKKQQEEAKKPEPIALSRAKRSTEMNRGASG